MDIDNALIFVKRAPPDAHTIFFYIDREYKHQVLFSFLERGLTMGAAGIYLAEEESTEQIREAMNQFGIDANRCEREGVLLLLPYTQWLRVGAGFDEEAFLRRRNAILSRFTKVGCRGVYIVKEMSGFIRRRRYLLEVEKLCNAEASPPISQICAYNIDLVPPYGEDHILLKLIMNHSHMITPNYAGMADLNDLYRQVVEGCLKAFLGESATQAVLYHLVNCAALRVDVLCGDPLRLNRALRKFFDVGASTIEGEILKSFYSRLGLEADR